MKKIYCAIFIIACISCKQQNQQQETLKGQDLVELQKEKIDPVTEVSLENFTYEEIAKYTMATIMNQPLSIIKVNKNNDLYFVSYVRKSDMQKFDYKIKFSGNLIIWGNSDGRWRDNELDEKISFSEESDKLKIIQTFSDGSESVEEFKKDQ